MKMFVRFRFSSEGASPIALIKVMTKMGFEPVMGEFDFVYEFDLPKDYTEALRKLHQGLKGLGVSYTLTTRKS